MWLPYPPYRETGMSGASWRPVMGFVFMKMNMKIQSGKAIIISALIISIMMPFSVSAAPSAGIKPSSIFYFLDIARERVGLFFTFGSEKKARKALEYADERLAEAEAVAGDKNTDAVKTAITNYEGNIAFAAEKSKEIGEKEKAKALLTTISDSTSRHQEVLADVLAKVPDEAKEAITKAIEASKKGHEEAMQKIAELKGEVEQLKKEVVELKAKSEAEIAKAEAERLSAKEKERTTAELEKQKEERVKAEAKAIQDETERQRLQAEKAKAEAETAKAEAERQRLQAEIDAYKAKEAAVNTQKQAEINKGIYCNGKYWSQCPVGQTFACPSSGNAYCSSPRTSTTVDNESETLKNAIQKEFDNRKAASEKKLALMNTIYAKYQPARDEITKRLNELTQKALGPSLNISESRQLAIDSLQLNSEQAKILGQLNGELCSQLGYCDYNQQSPSYEPPLFSNYDNFSVYVNGGQRVLTVTGTGNGFNATDSLTGGGYNVQNIAGNYFVQSY